MPIATLHLIATKESGTLTDILTAIRNTPSQSHRPIILSKPIRWIITPEVIDTSKLLSPSKAWDLLYIHPGTDPLPTTITTNIQDRYTLQIGIPSRLLEDFAARNQQLLHPPSSLSVPALTGSLDEPVLSTTSQDLSLSASLQEWVTDFSSTDTGQTAMSMLNLLAFKPGMKEEYVKYGREFARSIGSKRGGNAKLVGHVIASSPSPGKQVHNHTQDSDNNGKSQWEEFALAHYPSITHFADMLASRDYQDVNQKYRVPALRDTCILCTSEIEIERQPQSLSSSSTTTNTTTSTITSRDHRHSELNHDPDANVVAVDGKAKL